MTTFTRWTLIFAVALILALLFAPSADAQTRRPRRTPTPVARMTPVPLCSGPAGSVYGRRRCEGLRRDAQRGGTLHQPRRVATPTPVRRIRR